MKIGAMYPQYEMGAAPDDLRRFAVGVEAAGFDYLSFPDHVVSWSVNRDPPVPDMFNERDKWQDPFTVFGFLAAITQRIELHTGIFVLPQRPTALVARQAADVDLLSGERLCLAVGLGWNYAEYDALGQDYHKRGRRADEQIPLLRRLLCGEMVSFAGEFDRMFDVCLNPAPRRQIPIWMGGMTEPAYKRAAKLGGGFVFEGDFEIAKSKAERVLDYLDAENRPRDGFALEMMTASLDRTKHAGPQPSIDHLRRWRDWRGTHGSIASTEQGLQTIEQHLDFQIQVRDQILS